MAGERATAGAEDRAREKSSSAPMGAFSLSRQLPHGLRRGLHSCAALRLANRTLMILSALRGAETPLFHDAA